MVIYRGLSNIEQAKWIAIRETAGGYDNILCKYCCKCSLSCRKYGYDITCPPTFQFVDRQDESARKLIRSQVGDDSQMKCQIVNELFNDRWLIEYTTNAQIAINFGLIGLIETTIDEKYTSVSLFDVNNSPEKSVFCLSCAPIVNTLYFLTKNPFSKEFHHSKEFMQVDRDKFITEMNQLASQTSRKF